MLTEATIVRTALGVLILHWTLLFHVQLHRQSTSKGTRISAFIRIRTEVASG